MVWMYHNLFIYSPIKGYLGYSGNYIFGNSEKITAINIHVLDKHIKIFLCGHGFKIS